MFQVLFWELSMQQEMREASHLIMWKDMDSM